ncbi:hypothetical protein EXN66_Car009058 [Channa argus]|uniref:Uncharacterized protein n=1 Tax=Channa argus TaxID=215402 RepID=A0A6G1PSZ0_CHAAH|nr:hypothetical protein EXN66_Car009058 [Channa argus]
MQNAGKTQGQHEHRGQRERGERDKERDKAEPGTPKGRRSTYKPSGMKRGQPGERERGQCPTED